MHWFSLNLRADHFYQNSVNHKGLCTRMQVRHSLFPGSSTLEEPAIVRINDYVIKCSHVIWKCGCSQTINFFRLIPQQEMIASVRFIININQNRDIERENHLSMMNIWIIFKSCKSQWHVKHSQTCLNIYKNIFLKSLSRLILWKFWLN